jgi:predicted nucleic acid-binding protein
VITVDTSAMLELFDPWARDHAVVAQALAAQRSPYLVPAATLGELGYFVAQRFAPRVQRALLADLADGRWTLDCGEQDLDRVAELCERYTDLPLGIVDAAVAACAERSGGRILTLDRDFAVLAREGTLEVLP